MTPVSVDASLVLPVLAALSCMLMIGLGFLYRPSLPNLLWSVMFLVVLLSSIGQLIGQATGVTWLEHASEGFTLGAAAFAWSGLRAARGVRPFAWTGPIVCLVSAVALGIIAEQTSVEDPIHALADGLVYLFGAIWGAATVYELRRRPERGGGLLIPLVVISGILPVLAVAGLVVASLETVLGPIEDLIPDLTAIGEIVYVVCAMVTLLPLARDPSARPAGGSSHFRNSAEDRLARAEAAGERSWSVLAISLDDADVLREAIGEDPFRHVVERLAADITAAFPADADIGTDGSSGFLVLLSRSDAAVREHVRDLLARATTISLESTLTVEFAVSVGWADVRTTGYALDDLTAVARRARAEARASGGNRWHHAD
ncbi:hypothetical protein [Agromyces sp. LHK192]|uniref:hypothetical protein n=1 Tax=Agromyces sp. LHK192 TaxID=2498704 RepID=UPI000FDA4957|nr:hypothetical protein [Agromyces sp. LHK192]